MLFGLKNHFSLEKDIPWIYLEIFVLVCPSDLREEIPDSLIILCISFSFSFQVILHADILIGLSLQWIHLLSFYFRVSHFTINPKLANLSAFAPPPYICSTIVPSDYWVILNPPKRVYTELSINTYIHILNRTCPLCSCWLFLCFYLLYCNKCQVVLLIFLYEL